MREYCKQKSSAYGTAHTVPCDEEKHYVELRCGVCEGSGDDVIHYGWC